MTSKKLNNTFFGLILISFLIICSCNDNKVEDQRSAALTAVKRDTLNNFLNVNITFLPTASYQLRQEYLNEVKQFLTNYVTSANDSAKNQIFTAQINESVKDSLHIKYSLSINRTYNLSDSISNPRPNPCPPVPGPRSIAEAELALDCPSQ